jgi:quercetin dioxygenase-like cupin family protein
MRPDITPSPPAIVERSETLMDKHSLDAIAREQLDTAHGTAAQCSSTTVFGGHDDAVCQSVGALVAAAALGEHEKPGEATLHVSTGRMRLNAGTESCDAPAGDSLIIPDVRRGLDALEDSAVVLTAVPCSHIA